MSMPVVTPSRSASLMANGSTAWKCVSMKPGATTSRP
jgi:hypothetical protein